MKRRLQAARSTTSAGAGAAALLPWAGLVLILAATLAIRLRVADVPLERDEGEYAYAGQLILQGLPPYDVAYNMKFPGAYYAYAVLMGTFGQSAWGIHAGLALITGLSTVLLFLLARRWLSPMAAVVTAASFAVLSLDRWTMGIFAHATHFVVLPALAGFLVLPSREALPGFARCIAAGMLLGLAVLMKQHAAVYVVAASALLIWRASRQPEYSWRRTTGQALALTGGAAVPLAVMLVALLGAGVLDRFWFWTVQYAREYVSQLTPAEGWIALRQSLSSLTQATFAIWMLGLLGVVAVWRRQLSGDLRAFVACFGAASVAATIPGFYFRQHYFIVLLPVVALAAGAASQVIEQRVARVFSARTGAVAALLAGAVSVAVYVGIERDYLFRMPPSGISRSVYPGNPFVEAAEIGRYLSAQTGPDDRIAVVGSEPEIYFYAGRRSATGYLYTYGLMEPHPFASRMQLEMIEEIERTRPKFLLAVQVPWSWLVRPDSDRRIHTWLARYSSACYDLAATIPIGAPDTAWRWEPELCDPLSQPRSAIFIYRRRATEPCATTSAE